MSYILDALRRADAERDGASIHGGFGQARLDDDADEAELSPPASPWVWMAAGMLLVILAGVFWRWVVMDVPAAPVAVPVAPVAQVAQAAPPPPVAAPEVVPAPPVPASAVEPAPPVSARAASASPPVASREPKATARKAANPPRTSRQAELAPKSDRPPAAEARIYQLNELPDDIRRQLPQLTVGGAMYFDKPAERMVILNGRLFHEGDALTPNLSVRQIKLKSAVLEYRGFRYELNY